MTTDEHRARHKLLHQHLDELVADYIRHKGRRPSITLVMDLMAWSHQQTLDPTEDEREARHAAPSPG